MDSINFEARHAQIEALLERRKRLVALVAATPADTARILHEQADRLIRAPK
jgi:Spy/CpxP family protein refolding chaperone